MRTIATGLLAIALLGLTLAPSRLDLNSSVVAGAEPAARAGPSLPELADAARAKRLRHLLTMTSLVPGDALGRNHTDIVITGDDTVFIADPDFSRICAYALDGMKRFCFGEKGAILGKLQYQKAMVLAPDGNLLVQDSADPSAGDPSSMTGRLQRFTPKGELLDGRELPFILEAAGADGSLYGWNKGHWLVRLSSEGVLSEWGLEGEGDSKPFGWTPSVAVGPGGDIFVAINEPVQVRRYRPDGHLIGTWGEPGDQPGQLGGGVGVMRAGTDGNLLILASEVKEFGGYSVQRFTPDGRLLSSFRPAPHETDIFGPSFSAAAQAADGSILVAVGGDAIVQRYSPEGQRLAVWLNEGSEPQWLLPDSVALFGNADGSVRSIGREGDWVDVSATGAILGRGRVSFPPGVVPDSGVFGGATRRPNGDVCVINTLGDAWCIASSGQVTARWKWTDPAESGHSFDPGSIAAGSENQLWISDPLRNMLDRFDADGNKLGETPLPVPQELQRQCQNWIRGGGDVVMLPIVVEAGGSVLVVEQCAYERRSPFGNPGFHRVSASGEHLWRRDLAELFHLDSAPESLFIKTLSALPGGGLLVSATLFSSAEPPPPSNALWLLDPDSADPGMALDLGRDAKGEEIRSFRATLAGPNLLWASREHPSGSSDGDLDAFALEEEGAPVTPTAAPVPSSTAPATATGAPPSTVWLPWLER